MLSPSLAQDRVAALVDLARRAGADAADAIYAGSSSEGVQVRLGQLEDVERSESEHLDLRVFVGKGSASIGSSDLSDAALGELAERAVAMARAAPEDQFAGLAPAELLAHAPFPELDLSDSEEPSPQRLREIALACEDAARAVKGVTNSEGANTYAQQSHFVLANSRGFIGGYPYSRHSISVSPIAGRGNNMQRDDWYSSDRNPAKLASPESVGRYAAERALSRLNARKLDTRKCPVLFEAPLACGLLGAFVQAVSGGSLYRKSTFLTESIGKQVFDSHIQLHEDPHVPGAVGSAPFDEEGVRTRQRDVVKDGVVQGYFLSSYSARKLGMQTTGNAGGSHNLTLVSTRTQASDDFAGMLKKMGTGLLVTELMGHGVNYVTGDYSRGASGYWVENGVIQYPVEEITIAGNMKDMFNDIVAIGNDVLSRGTKNAGSILIGSMTIAGS